MVNRKNLILVGLFALVLVFYGGNIQQAVVPNPSIFLDSTEVCVGDKIPLRIDVGSQAGLPETVTITKDQSSVFVFRSLGSPHPDVSYSESSDSYVYNLPGLFDIGLPFEISGTKTGTDKLDLNVQFARGSAPNYQKSYDIVVKQCTSSNPFPTPIIISPGGTAGNINPQVIAIIVAIGFGYFVLLRKGRRNE